MNSKMNITLTLPGKIVDVSGNNQVTLEFPVIDVPVVSLKAAEVLTNGLTSLDSEILLERIGHYAMTESVRARISMGCISTIKTSSEKWEATPTL